MAGFYESWLASPGLGPNWMHGPVGQAYWSSIGKVLDQQVTRLKLGARMRYPDDAATLGMADALELIGQDRLLPRGIVNPGSEDESLASWSARLKNAWTTWEAAGNPRGMLLELKAQGFPMGDTGASILNHIGRRYYLDASDVLVISSPGGVCVNRTDRTGVIPSPPLSGFTLDARDQFYSHFILLFLQNAPTLLDDPGNVPKAILNQTAQRWRQAGSHYAGAAIVSQAISAKVIGWPPTMCIGDEGLVFGDNNARFIHPE
jgi:hypothetical protein